MTQAGSWDVSDLSSIVHFLRDSEPNCILIEAASPYDRLVFVTDDFVMLKDPFLDGEAQSSFWSQFQFDPMAARIEAFSDINVFRKQGAMVVLHLRNRSQLSEHKAIIKELGTSCLLPVTCADDVALISQDLSALGYTPVRFVDRLKRDLNYVAGFPAGWLEDHSNLLKKPLFKSNAFTLELPRKKDESGQRYLKIHQVTSNCPWFCEGARDYSWRWTGPEIIDLTCLGDWPASYSRLDVDLIHDERHVDLSRNISFLINGRSVEFDILNPTARGGAIAIKLPKQFETPMVLGVGAYPNARPDKTDLRTVRACLQGLICRT
ncbi:MAG: hypothetical protein CMK09_06440 [Ponticaulis sp.]|nr:hypothetical protein [Ponticaulis sp.]|tara:strand:- start:12251 stop:13213 length:963 start_codon:yes stop_codon:yes gene_type:complete